MNRLERLRDAARKALAVPSPASRADLLPNSVGNTAFLHLEKVATAAVLGLEVDENVLEQDRRWLEDSVTRGEVFGDPPDYFTMVHCEALALSTWMLTGRTDEEVFAEAVRRHELALGQMAAAGQITADGTMRDYLPDLVRDCLSAGLFHRGVASYTRHAGPPPQEPDSVETPLQLAAWLCHELDRFAPPAAWVAVGSRVLRPVLLDWLDRGQGVEAALWLKVVFADSGAALTPVEALRRGGELIGALPADPLADVMLESFGDPVDVDLFAGFLAAAGGAAGLDGATITVEFDDRPPLVIAVTEPEITTSLDEAIVAALAVPHPGSLTGRLTTAARGRIVDIDGHTPLELSRITIR
jgi:hypothetical protein